VEPLRAGLNRRPDLRADGVTDSELRALRRRGVLTTLRPGAYLAGAPPDDAAARHRLVVLAALPHLAHGTVVSHTSAATLHGLPLWGVRLGRVHATRSRTSGARSSGVVHLHAATLASDEVVVVDGVLVTSVARTLADLGRALPFEAALVPVDAALFRGLVAPDELVAAVDRAARRPNNGAARRVVAFADGRAESVGETRSRVAIRRAGLPPPVLQYPVIGTRTDFCRADGRTVGEFDGRVKYSRRHLRAGETPGDAVFAEKRREDALRDHGLEVVRRVWDELDTFDAPRARLRRAFARTARPTPQRL
jgi:predicted transcriptional regulator of viral defense system